jgi:hypothetical protein
LSPTEKRQGKEETFIKVCVSVHHKDIPSGATQEQMLPITHSFTVYLREIVVECNIDFIQSVGRSIHANIFSYRSMRGMMNTFRVHFALTVGRVHSFCAIDPTKHIESYHSLHLASKHYFSAGESMFVECNAIRDRTRHILSRVGQKQKQYGKNKIKISSGTWMILKNKLMSMSSPPDEHKMHC